MGERINQDWYKNYREKESILKLLRSWLAQQNFEYVVRNIKYANAKSNAVNAGAAPGKGSNYRNYLAKALREDFGLSFKEDLEALNSSKEEAHKRELELKQIQESQANKLHQEQKDIEQARVYQESLFPKDLQTLREEALKSLDTQQQSLVLRKTPGSEMLVKMAMNRVSMTRMKISQPPLFEKEKFQQS